MQYEDTEVRNEAQGRVKRGLVIRMVETGIERVKWVWKEKRGCRLEIEAEVKKLNYMGQEKKMAYGER